MGDTLLLPLCQKEFLGVLHRTLFTSDVKSLQVYRQETSFAVAVLLRNDNFVQRLAPTRSENYPV